MPANLSPQYLKTEQRYRHATTSQDKMKCLQEMLSGIPKHKGTEKLQAQIKTRIAKLKQESQKKLATRKEADFLAIKKEGAGQVVLIGLPNAGKSEIISSITHASPEVADYPHTTRKPTPGMLEYENIQIQLIDMPPLTNEYLESWMPQMIRNADAVLMVIDLSDDVIPQLETISELLEKIKMKPKIVEDQIETEKDCEFFEDSMIHKNTLLVGTKSDLELSAISIEMLKEHYGTKYPLTPISTRKKETLELLKRRIFEVLNILRVYTKPPGKQADLSAPDILPTGSTVEEVAEHVHKDFLEKLNYARLWRTGAYQGQRVQRDFIVEDGDVIELHI